MPPQVSSPVNLNSSRASKDTNEITERMDNETEYLSYSNIGSGSDIYAADSNNEIEIRWENSSLKSLVSSASTNRSTKTAKSLNDVVMKKMQVGQYDKALLRRIRDFKFAQRKRRSEEGGEGGQKAAPIGILGIYASLQGVRRDVEWAEDSAYRRTHNIPYLKWKDFEKTQSMR